LRVGEIRIILYLINYFFLLKSLNTIYIDN
jgi:hypothetical protein